MVKKRAAPRVAPTKASGGVPLQVAIDNAESRSMARDKQKAPKAKHGKPWYVEVGDNGAPKVVRDSFTMPVSDYQIIGALKKKCLKLGIAVKKSELLRGGLHALERMSDEALIHAVSRVETLKTGRPPGKRVKKVDSTDTGSNKQ